MSETPMLDAAEERELTSSEIVSAFVELQQMSRNCSQMPWDIMLSATGFAQVLDWSRREIAAGGSIEDALLACRKLIEEEIAAS